MAYTIIPPDGRGDSVGITLLFFSAFSLLLAIVAIALRLWVRHIKSTPLALNDWLLFVGWVFSLGLTIIIVIFVTIGGLGQDQKNVSKESITLTLQVWLRGSNYTSIANESKLLPAAETLWAAANTAVKVSILLVYKDIFALRSFRRAADTAIVVVIMLGVGNTIQCLAICRPFSFQWDKTIEGGKCGNQNLGILLVAFLNLVTDLIIVIMPMPLVWNLKMPRHKRLALIGIFSLGIMYSPVITQFEKIFADSREEFA
ncbi:hypothetical protein HYFRA_00007253 [Hymenoscyphus fraxineus]|uniref:Rhodopsin domain-containing protein n=1 Tax=Hymenoscyphus fraxineus TaxID=746836 RepID=A0A9N9PQ06_9HELO|nr:hypothetical protein HYFRA_00007253 [Hymenoscyphus fraxineus]